MGGPGDLMETKVKEKKNFRESSSSPEVLGRLEGYFGEKLGSHPGFTLASFLFLSFFFFFLACLHHVIQDAKE